jgi:hypothetical protein
MIIHLGRARTPPVINSASPSLTSTAKDFADPLLNGPFRVAAGRV